MTEELRSADERALIASARQLEVELPAGIEGHVPQALGSEGVDTSMWEGPRLRLFICHLADHKQYAAEIKEYLQGWGISSFVAHTDIVPDDEWIDTIEDALRSCHALVAMLHEGFRSSPWTAQEIGWAYGRGVPVLAVMLGENPFGFFGRKQGGGPRQGESTADHIIRRLRNHTATASRMEDSTVHAFVEADSFDEARNRCRHLLEAKELTPQMVADLEQAIVENGQLRGAV